MHGDKGSNAQFLELKTTIDKTTERHTIFSDSKKYNGTPEYK
jgi:hypothetical protein